MRKLVKKMAMIMLVVTLIMTSTTNAFAATVSVSGKAQNMTTEIAFGRTFVSTESLKAFGLQTTITGNSIKIFNAGVTFQFTNHSNIVKVNDASITLEARAYIRGNTAYVPMKFIFETLNYSVGYNATSKHITLTPNASLKFPLTIEDSGKTYTFSKESKRIVSLAPSITEILFAIGAGNLVVGRTNYCSFPAEVSKVESIGTLYEPNLEKILDLEPDTVIAATHMNEDVMGMLSKAKIQTLTQASPSKIDEIFVLIEQLGKLTGKNYEARAVVSSMRAKLDRVGDVMKRLPESARKKVYYVVGTGKSEFTAGKNTFISDVLIRAGAINVATDVDRWSYSLEKLIEKNPEYLIGADYSFETMKGSSNYASLSALGNGKTIVVNTDIFSIPGPRVVDYSIKTIIQKLYPELAYLLRF